ncbi:MAG: dipeptide epimerase [Chitinophagaceae bacterium]|nr:dipeptide epimerase [Chitinophagaceae bacterium]
MIIKQIELYKLTVPLKEPFTTSLGTEEAAENVLVRILTDQGLTGFGECSPYLPVNGESQETCLIVGRYFAQALLGKNALQIEDLVNLMDKIIYANYSIKSAFDMALYDLAAQHAGRPLYQFLGGEKKKTIITDYTVSLGTPEKMAEDAQKIIADGFTILKVKLGDDGEKDVARIKAIRDATGNDIPLRIDANQGWKVKEAIRTLQKLEDYGIEFCEEPVSRHKYHRLAKIRKHSPIPLMADESCGNAYDAERLIKMKACDYFNIKLGKSGGIFKACKIVEKAEEAGMAMQIGAMLESRIGMTAFAHFSLISPFIRYYDFDTSLMFSEDPAEGGIRYLAGGVIEVPDTPGLGASIREEWLGHMEKIIIR